MSTRRRSKTGKFCRSRRWSTHQSDDTQDILSDHGYAATAINRESQQEAVGDNVVIEHVVAEEVVCDAEDFVEPTSSLPKNLKSVDDCRVVVDLGAFIQNLNCSVCTAPLHLTTDRILGIHTTGITGDLFIVCPSDVCSQVNAVPLGKKQKPSVPGRHPFDMNKKLPLGM